MARSNSNAPLPVLLPALALLAALACFQPPPHARAGAADNSGAFSFRIPIEVPPGAAGATPDLALVYSSAAGNGSAGIGWELPYSRISVDLRRGVPTWALPDGGYDCDPDALQGWIWIDGMETVPWDGDPVWGAPGRCVFRTRPDSFALAVPIFSEPPGGCPDADADALLGQPSAWVVVQPDGRSWWYGDAVPCDTTYRRLSPGRMLLPAGPGTPPVEAPPVVSEWLLQHVADRDGNLVTFWPDRAARPDWRAFQTIPSASDPADSSACAGCLRAVSWGRRMLGLHGAPVGDFAWGATPVDDPASEFACDWPLSGYSGDGPLSGRFETCLDDPGQCWPSPQEQFYVARIDWEDRPDTRVSYLAGDERVADRRIRQIGIQADVDVSRDLDGAVSFQAGASFASIRTYRLHYQSGSTGRSRLVRVFPLPGRYAESGNYAGVPIDGDAPWNPADPALATDDTVVNPWEFVWSDSLTLEDPDPDGSVSLPIPEPDSAMSFSSAYEEPWLGSQYAEGGHPTIVLQDMNGDSLPDLVQHDVELSGYVPIDASLVDELWSFLDTPPWLNDTGLPLDYLPDNELHIRWNQGDGFSDLSPGPVDPFALQAVGDFVISYGDNGNSTIDVLPGDGSPNPTSACEVWWSGIQSAMYQLTGGPPPALPPGEKADAAWCEFRSCAPFCEAGVSVTTLWDHLLAGLPGPSIGDPMEEYFGVELLEPPEADPSALHSSGELVLWSKYAVTRISTGSAAATSASMWPFDQELSGFYPVLELATRVRWVDGYSQLSFQTRVRSENAEALRHGDWLAQSYAQPGEYANTVQEGLVHDTTDIDGDGCPDRLLGGVGVLDNEITGDHAVFNKDPFAIKDQIVFTSHMPWMVALGDCESGAFQPMQPWPLPLTHEWLAGSWFDGSSGAFPYGAYVAEWNNDMALVRDHGLEFLGLWEGNNQSSRAAVSAGASGRLGFLGPSAGLSASFGPLSVSLGATAQWNGSASAGPSIGIGPVSLSPGGISMGGTTYSFSDGTWSSSAAAWVAYAVTKALDAFDLPYAVGIGIDTDGVSWSFGPGGGDSIAPNQVVRWERQGLHDMNGDGRPDLVVADQPTWESLGLRDALDWVVLFNNGEGFDEPVPWPGVHTQYVSAQVTDGYKLKGSGGVAPPAQLRHRRSHQAAGLVDMNGDGLPDFVWSNVGTDSEQISDPYSRARGAHWDEIEFADRTASWLETGNAHLWVQLNSGHGFEPEPLDWLVDGVPEEFLSIPGHFPAISSSRSYIPQSSLITDGGAVDLAGLRDWNGDGLPDLWVQAPFVPQDLEAIWIHGGEPVVYLNTGRGFAQQAISPTNRYGRFEMGTTAFSSTLQSRPPWLDASTSGPLVQFGRDRNWEPPGGSVTQSAFLDLDGDGRLDWAQSVQGEPEGPAGPARIELFPLQYAVPDLLSGIWQPGGAFQSLAYAPARDFMDLPFAPAPEPPPAAAPLSDGMPDAFPAPSQVLVAQSTYDGLGLPNSPPITEEIAWADPVYDPGERRSLGFARVRRSTLDVSQDEAWYTDRWRAGLLHRTETLDLDGSTLWERSETKWSGEEFVDNHPPGGLSLVPVGHLAMSRLNWHYAPVALAREHWEPPTSGSKSLRSFTWTQYDPRNGLARCVQEDPDGDAFVDRVTWTEFDGGLLADGFQAAAASEGLVALPAATFAPLGAEGDCARAPWSSHLVRRTETSRFPSGRPQSVAVHDAQGISPGPRVEDYGYTPDGQRVLRIDAAGESHWTLYDPVVGAAPVAQHGPVTALPDGSPVGHVASSGHCGLSPVIDCPDAAWGLLAQSVDEAGLESRTAYDTLGRPWFQADSLSYPYWDESIPNLADYPGPSFVSYQRSVRVGAAAQPPLAPGAVRAGVLSSETPSGSIGGPDGGTVLRREFLDGLGRVAMRRESWVSDDGTPGWKVGGVELRDARGRTVAAPWPCFSLGDWSSPEQFLNGFDPLAADLGTCTEAPPQEQTDWDLLGRATRLTRPDGAVIKTERRVAPMAQAWTETWLEDPSLGTLEHTRVLASPRQATTRRDGAATWRHASTGPALPQEPIPDADVLETYEVFDALGRRIAVSRTGVPAGEETSFLWDGYGGLVAYSDPDQGSWEFDYDGAGRLTERRLRDGAGGVERRTDWTLDALGRPLLDEHFALDTAGTLLLDEFWERVWDEELEPFAALPAQATAAGGARGRLAMALHSRIEAGAPEQDVVHEYRWDLRGRAVDERQTLTAADFAGSDIPEALSAQSAWSNLGVRTWLRMPLTGEEITTWLDAAGQPEALSGSGGETYVAWASRDVHGRARVLELGNGVAQEFFYEPGAASAQALMRTVLDGPAGALLDRTYDRDAAGNLRSWEDAAATWNGAPVHGERWDCDYDGVGKLLGCALDGSAEQGVAYRHDVLGNLIWERVELPGIHRESTQHQRALGGAAAVPIPGFRVPLDAPVARAVALGGLSAAGQPPERLSSLHYDARGQLVMQMAQGVPQPGAQLTASEAGLLDATTGALLPVEAWRHFDWDGRGRLRAVQLLVPGAGAGFETVGRHFWDAGGGRMATVALPHPADPGAETV
jgi:YD repeat-containing protein